MKKLLIVVDMQNFFTVGPLRTPEARAVVPKVALKIRNYDGAVYVTQDINPHCAEGSEGFEIHPEIKSVLPGDAVYFIKRTFGCVELAQAVSEEYNRLKTREPAEGPLMEIEFCGVCTNVCVISNALMMKAFLPGEVIAVDVSCCAGDSPEMHDAAVAVMKSCRIEMR